MSSRQSAATVVVAGAVGERLLAVIVDPTTTAEGTTTVVQSTAAPLADTPGEAIMARLTADKLPPQSVTADPNSGKTIITYPETALRDGYTIAWEIGNGTITLDGEPVQTFSWPPESATPIPHLTPDQIQ